MNKTTMNYQEALAELEALVLEMEHGEIAVDELSEKIKRSAFLLRFCKAKLKSTEEEVEKILLEMDDNN
jgi:exodeoxyribonuclease VII small subunit